MYILNLYQNDTAIDTDLALFETIEEGRNFVSKLPGYKLEEKDSFVYESFEANSLPEYLELEYKGNIVPFTRFMFPGEDDVFIYWIDIPNLSKLGRGMVDSVTRVDAYSVSNEDLIDYIGQREDNYRLVEKYLINKGFEVSRSFQGSEDGEAILYKEVDSKEWHFLTHMDHSFVESHDILSEIEDML